MKRLSLVFAITLLLSLPLYAQVNIDTTAAIKNNADIYSLIVVKNNKLLYKRFFNGYNAQSLFNDQSLTKNICSILIGIAINKGYISSVDEKLAAIFPQLKNDPDKWKQTITIRQVMNQASGLAHENLENLGGYLSLPNPSEYVLKAPLVDEPGKEWHYNNAATHLLSVILTKTTHMDTRAFAQKNLFGPLGITKFEWAKMRDGYYDGCGLLSIRLSSGDMLKFGQLLLNNGKYNGRQIVPAKWVNLLFNPDVFYQATWGFPQSTYGLCYYHFNYKGVAVTYGMGWGGQFLVMIPAKQAIMVINQNTADANAIKQSINFTSRIFPMLFKLVE